MARTYGYSGLTIPENAVDTLALEDHFAAYTNGLDAGRTLLRFATPTARDAAISVANRKAGMHAWIDSLGMLQRVSTDQGAWEVAYTRDVFNGSEGALVGTPPAAGTVKIRQEFTNVQQVANSAGGVGFPYPQAFANGLVFVMAVPGDNASNLGFLVPIMSNMTKSAWNGIAFQDTGARLPQGSAIRANIIAVGW